jgi:hypothetical protein
MLYLSLSQHTHTQSRALSLSFSLSLTHTISLSHTRTVMERQGDASHVHGLESHTTQGDAGGDAGGDSSQWVCDPIVMNSNTGRGYLKNKLSPFLSRFSSLSEYLDIVT